MNRRDTIKKSFASLMLAPVLNLAAETSHPKSHSLNGTSKLFKAPDKKLWKSIQNDFKFEPRLTYLNNASLGPTPQSVSTKHAAFTRQFDSHPSKYMWGGWADEKEMVRTTAAQFLNVDAEEIAFVRNTTEGMNIVAASMDLQAGDEVILGNHEHPSGVIPWLHWQEKHRVRFVKPQLPLIPESKAAIVDVYRKAITPKTKVISIVHITNTNGMILPIKEISEMAHQHGILVAVDGAQSLAHIPVDLADLGCDYYAGSCHKWLFSPKGMGVFYARKDAQHHLKPLMVASGYKDKSIRRLENYNTRNLAELMALGSCFQFQNELGTHRIDRILALKNYFRKQFGSDERFMIKTPASDDLSAGIQSVEVVGTDIKALYKYLNEENNINFRGMTTHGLNALRISLAVYNAESDVDLLKTKILQYL